MVFKPTLRSATTVLTLTALVACSGGTAIEPHGSPLATSAAASATSPATNTGSPCDLSGFWYFHGSCKAFAINAKGTTIRLTTYQGLKVQESLPQTIAQHKVTFVTGDATGAGDISGSFEGMAFPSYGSIGCTNLNGSNIACHGKAALYTVIANTSAEALSFNATPVFSIANTGNFPGKSCELSQLYKVGTALVWQRYPLRSAVANNTITFRPFRIVQYFPPNTQAVFGFICY